SERPGAPATAVHPQMKGAIPMTQRVTPLYRRQSSFVSYLSLFTSFGTLLCCALPSLLVLLGLAATVASFLSAVPWLVTLSHHKNWVFAVSGILIALSFFQMYLLP